MLGLNIKHKILSVLCRIRYDIVEFDFIYLPLICTYKNNMLSLECLYLKALITHVNIDFSKIGFYSYILY